MKMKTLNYHLNVAVVVNWWNESNDGRKEIA